MDLGFGTMDEGLWIRIRDKDYAVGERRQPCRFMSQCLRIRHGVDGCTDA
jgi:hypothetical protein